MAKVMTLGATNGFVQIQDDAEFKIDGTAGEALSVGEVVYQSGGNVMVYDTSDADTCNAIEGDCTLAAAAATNPTQFVRNGKVATGLSGLTAGATYYVDPTDGSLVGFGSVPASNWTRQIGVALSTTELLVQIGPTIETQAA